MEQLNFNYVNCRDKVAVLPLTYNEYLLTEWLINERERKRIFKAQALVCSRGCCLTDSGAFNSALRSREVASTSGRRNYAGSLCERQHSRPYHVDRSPKLGRVSACMGDRLGIPGVAGSTFCPSGITHLV